MFKIPNANGKTCSIITIVNPLRKDAAAQSRPNENAFTTITMPLQFGRKVAHKTQRCVTLPGKNWATARSLAREHTHTHTPVIGPPLTNCTWPATLMELRTCRPHRCADCIALDMRQMISRTLHARTAKSSELSSSFFLLAFSRVHFDSSSLLSRSRFLRQPKAHTHTQKRILDGDAKSATDAPIIHSTRMQKSRRSVGRCASANSLHFSTRASTSVCCFGCVSVRRLGARAREGVG